MRIFKQTISLFLLFQTSLSIKFSEYILAPSSRTVFPRSINAVRGNITDPDNILRQDVRSTHFLGENASVTLDFGQNVAGRISFVVDSVTADHDRAPSIGLTYSESSLWISTENSDGTGNGVNVSQTRSNIQLFNML